MAVAHRSRLVPLLLAGCLLVPACRRAGPPAQVVVLINGEPLIKEQLAEAGIQVTILAHDKKTFFEGTGRKSYFFMSAVASNSGDASDLFDSTTDVSSEEAVALGSTNPLTRLDVLKRLLARMTEECVFVPLYAEDEIYAVSPRLRWEARQDMMLLGREMDRS